ncbi:ABC transporter ATP-binding protein [Psychrobacter aquaticus]|uniref:Urea carboxylase-related ABC transporter, ATPase protein n=1 Tax=Psychrobacter aquaticus CMS 56 TaxID=1354303 RepID=U4T3E4_9GAMM|nr:ABC transporter ATP-binding protein [Psychrobacter aquaticus]ERL55732.1 Urea carboxylase-related ABC transporter, ATPase protein [Psychrobacter aquaticus CMS 56]
MMTHDIASSVAVNSAHTDHQQVIDDYFKALYQRNVVLKVDNLTQSFDQGGSRKVILKEVSLQIHEREFVCVIGPSGCGKSTLGRIIAGLDAYPSGEVIVDNERVKGPSASRGMVFQGYTLFPWKTVKENVMFGPIMEGRSKSNAERSAREWLDIVGLSKYENHYPHQLSGGMKQRVAIARALINEPKVLIMDEPFGALDPYTRQKMQKHLLDLWRNIDITIVFITHDMDEAVLLSDRIVVLKANPGEVQDIIEVPLARPRHPDIVTDSQFLQLKARINSIVHNPQPEIDPALVEMPDIPRMTPLDTYK